MLSVFRLRANSLPYQTKTWSTSYPRAAQKQSSTTKKKGVPSSSRGPLLLSPNFFHHLFVCRVIGKSWKNLIHKPLIPKKSEVQRLIPNQCIELDLNLNLGLLLLQFGKVLILIKYEDLGFYSWYLPIHYKLIMPTELYGYFTIFNYSNKLFRITHIKVCW